MAKGERRGNREAKKPKQPKKPPVVAVSPFASPPKTTIGTGNPKKK